MKYISIGLALFWTFSVLTVVDSNIDVNISDPMTSKSSIIKLTKNELDDKGNLTESGIIKLLSNAYPNTIQDKFFESSKNLEISQFAKTAGNLPIFKISNTSQLFDKQFVVKEVPKAEFDNLLRIYSVEKLQELIELGQQSNLYPELIVPIYAITYDYNQKTHFVVVMLMSRGKELANFMLNYLESNTKTDLDASNKAFESVGIALANFQKYLGDDASNYIHGDFHNKNIFVEPNTTSNIDKIYWIDIERMTDYRFPPKTALVDIIYLLSTLNLVLRGKQLAIWNNAQEKRKEIFIKNAAQALISGYILRRYDDKKDRMLLHTEINDRLYDDLKHDKNPSGVWGFTTFLKKYQNEIKDALKEVEGEINQGKTIHVY